MANNFTSRGTQPNNMGNSPINNRGFDKNDYSIAEKNLTVIEQMYQDMVVLPVSKNVENETDKIIKRLGFDEDECLKKDISRISNDTKSIATITAGIEKALNEENISRTFQRVVSDIQFGTAEIIGNLEIDKKVSAVINSINNSTEETVSKIDEIVDSVVTTNNDILKNVAEKSDFVITSIDSVKDDTLSAIKEGNGFISKSNDLLIAKAEEKSKKIEDTIISFKDETLPKINEMIDLVNGTKVDISDAVISYKEETIKMITTASNSLRSDVEECNNQFEELDGKLSAVESACSGLEKLKKVITILVIMNILTISEVAALLVLYFFK